MTDLTDTAILSDTFEAIHTSVDQDDVVVPIVITLNEHPIRIRDVLTFNSTKKITVNFDDRLSLQDIQAVKATDRYVKTFPEEIVSITEVFGYYATNRHYISLDDIVGIGEIFSHAYKDHPTANMEDVLVLSEEFSFYKTFRHVVSFGDDVISLTEDFKQMVDLVIIGGTGTGLYEAGENVSISVILENDEHFAVWVGDVATILSIVAKSTNVVVRGASMRITAIKDKVPRGFSSSGDIMSAAIVDLTMQQGSVFKRNIYYKDSNGDPINLTGYTAAFQVRKAKDSASAEVDISTSQGYIVINPTLGHIEIHIPASQTDDYDFDYGFYDLELYPEGDINQAFRILEGRVKMVRQVTR